MSICTLHDHRLKYWSIAFRAGKKILKCKLCEQVYCSFLIIERNRQRTLTVADEVDNCYNDFVFIKCDEFILTN